MFIQTEITPNPNSLKFIPGKTVSNYGSFEITKKDETNNDLIRKFDSPIYLEIWRTLKILRILNALIAIMVSNWAPININEMYLGIVASKSIIP